jgi:hypothetical protein
MTVAGCRVSTRQRVTAFFAHLILSSIQLVDVVAWGRLEVAASYARRVVLPSIAGETRLGRTSAPAIIFAEASSGGSKTGRGSDEGQVTISRKDEERDKMVDVALEGLERNDEMRGESKMTTGREVRRRRHCEGRREGVMMKRTPEIHDW